MFRVRTLAAAILMGAISGTALAASAPPISVADNMPAPTPVTPITPILPSPGGAAQPPFLQCCRTECPGAHCTPGHACPQYCVRVCTHC